MNIIKRFLKRRKFAKAQADAEKIASLTIPFLNMVGELTSHILHRNISSWSLSNQTLLDYLGYVAGVIDAAEYSLGIRSTDNWTATEIVFRQVIDAQLDWIPGSEYFIKLNRIGIEFGGTTIGGLQDNPQFLDAMKYGGNDFLSVGSLGFYTKGLFELARIFHPKGIKRARLELF